MSASNSQNEIGRERKEMAETSDNSFDFKGRNQKDVELITLDKKKYEALLAHLSHFKKENTTIRTEKEEIENEKKVLHRKALNLTRTLQIFQEAFKAGDLQTPATEFMDSVTHTIEQYGVEKLSPAEIEEINKIAEDVIKMELEEAGGISAGTGEE